mgnify:CR=1 FL=1
MKKSWLISQRYGSRRSYSLTDAEKNGATEPYLGDVVRCQLFDDKED